MYVLITHICVVFYRSISIPDFFQWGKEGGAKKQKTSLPKLV